MQGRIYLWRNRPIKVQEGGLNMVTKGNRLILMNISFGCLLDRIKNAS